eukprot:SAG31_NODE_36475_length_313_cov_0.668224_1_plen_75_part_10
MLRAAVGDVNLGIESKVTSAWRNEWAIRGVKKGATVYVGPTISEQQCIAAQMDFAALPQERAAGVSLQSQTALLL